MSAQKNNLIYQYKKQKTKGKRENDKTKQMGKSDALDNGGFVGGYYGFLCCKFPD